MKATPRSFVRAPLLLLAFVAALGSAACKSEKNDEAAPDSSAAGLDKGAPGDHPRAQRALPPAAFDAC